MNKISNFSERSFIGKLLQTFHEPQFTSTKEWMESNIYLSSQQSDDQGLIDLSRTPWMLLLLELLDEPKVKRIITRKSSRVGYTTIINGWTLKRALQDKVNTAFCFPKKDSLVTYFNDFFKPAILTTPEAKRIVSKNTFGGVKKLNPRRVQFDNCTVKLLNLGTASDTKSIFAPNINIEEPDEIKRDVGKQGNAIQLVEDRGKTAKNTKFNIGGTPTDSSFSQIALFFKESNQMQLFVRCHHENCKQTHALTAREAWDNFQFTFFHDGHLNSIYGAYDPNSVLYLCPHCNNPWSFEEKNVNVSKSISIQMDYIHSERKNSDKDNFEILQDAVSGSYVQEGWLATNPSVEEIFGFQMGELISSFPGCNFLEQAKSILIAKKRYDDGFEEEMRKHVNTKMGYEYAPLHTGVGVDELIKKRLVTYKEGYVPPQGLILFCTIDKQRGSLKAGGPESRFECIVRAWGRNNNSYLIKYEVIEGNTTDRTDPVWERLTDFINSSFESQAYPGKFFEISAVAIDCADDSRLVYDWVNEVTETIDRETGLEKTPKFCSSLFGNAVFAVRGLGQNSDKNKPIYNDPRSFMEVENGAQERRTVAESMGITAFGMGTTASHTELTRRLNLTGMRDRFYHIETEIPGYEKSILSCTKNVDGYWKQIVGWPKEVRDCERMQLWLADVPLVCGDSFVCISQMSNTMWANVEYNILKRWGV